MRFIIDSRYFDGVVITSMRDDMHSDYGGETLEEMRARERNPHLISITPERIMHLIAQHERVMQEPFHEITAERYYDLLGCVPPKRQHCNWFFVGEAYSGNLYDLCFRLAGRYFKALRPLTASDSSIEAMISEFANRLSFRPALIKGNTVRQYVSWYNTTVAYTPYFFERDGKQCFIYSLCSETGRDMDDKRHRREMAYRLLELRRNRYGYLTFYSHISNIFEFFKWLRDNHYTLEVHERLFSFANDRSYVDFSGNVLEYSAAFHYRIYSRELFTNIIGQLRRIKRHQLWK